MAGVPVRVPGVGESITEGILSRWLKADGAFVTSGEPLFELETDKASTQVPAPADGVLKIQVAEGSTVSIGTAVGDIDPDRKPAGDGEAPPKQPKAATAVPAARQDNGAKLAEPSKTLSPAARRVADEEGVDLSQVKGTGRGGLVTKQDVLEQAAAAKGQPSTAVKESRPAVPNAPPAPPLKVESAPAPASHGQPRQTRERMSGIRQKIAQRLLEAQQSAAILTTFNEADMTRVIDLRSRYKETFQKKHGVGLGFMSFFVKAAIEALKAYPHVNGRIEGNEVVLNHFYDIGVAVSTERGLMVPVVRDADRKSFAEIELAIANFAKKARENTISVDDLQGGTFTITNGGVFGSLLSTPILNPPQSAILGMHSIQKRAVVVDEQLAIRPMMYLALSYDHRIIDGREAVSALVRIKECIENPERVLIEI
jgi:2-oxoglutarate dehydrogenase E2 component (dihydrolipoamide succinyltransferase)